MNILHQLTLLAALFFFPFHTYAQNGWSPNQQSVLDAIEKLSATTAPNGQGADAYGSLLDDEFSRWTIGSTITNNKEKWVEGIRGWFDEGWSVAERKQNVIEILILGQYAHTRRIVTETYLGPDGNTSTSKAALAEIWIKKNGLWLLYRVNVHPIKEG